MGRGFFEVMGRAWAGAVEREEGRFFGSGGGDGDGVVFIRRWGWGFGGLCRGGLVIWGVVSGSVGVGLGLFGGASAHDVVERREDGGGKFGS